MTNITFSADKQAIEDARAAARENNTTLNEEFRKWLLEYGHAARRTRVMRTIDEVSKIVKLRGPFSRDEMNAR